VPRLSRLLLLPFASLTLILTSLSVPAHAAGLDTWIKWNLGDTWIRSLDYVNGTQLVAGSETSGVFTASSSVGPWTDISGNLSTTGKQVRQAVGLSGQIYLATSAGLFSGSGNGTWTQLGVAESTPEPQRLNQGGVQSVVFPTGQASYAVVGTSGSGRDGAFYSSDSGVSWTKAGGLTGGVYYMTGNASAMYAAGSTGFWKSTDSGKSWTLRSDGIPPGESAKRIAVSPLNSQQLIAATVGGVYRSDNGGTSWYDASGSGAGLLNVGEVRAFQLVPSQYWNGGLPHIVVGTSNGVWATSDGGLNWAKMSPDKGNGGEINMGSESVYALNIGFGTPGSLIAGTQGHGIFTLPLHAAAAPGTIPAPSGTPVENNVLTANTGTWTGTLPFGFLYQWKRCTNDSSEGSCTTIAGATDKTYVVSSLDVGDYLRVGVRARSVVQLNYSSEKMSSPTAIVTSPPDPVPTPPSGFPKLLNSASAPWGTTFTIDESDHASEWWKANGTSTATTFIYRWYRCDANVANCALTPNTGKTYATTTADVNHKIVAYVIGKIGNAYSDEKLAGISGAVYEQTPQAVAAPQVVGPAHIGTELHSTAGAWTGTKPTFSRRWLRCNADGVQCGVTSPVVTTPAYVVTAADRGYTFRIEVTAAVVDDFQTRTAVAVSATSPVVGDAPVVVVPPTAAECAALDKAVAKKKKALKKAKKALKKAKKTGKKAKIKKAKAKVKKAKKKLKKAKAAQSAAGC
jgi:hypothetical protein